MGTFNSIGAATYLEYRPSTQWGNTMMPFVTWTVTRIEHNDGLCDAAGCITAGGHTTATDVIYYNGMFDGVNRQFRGFEWVDARQSGAASESRLGRMTLFLQGAATAGKGWVTWEYDLKNGGIFTSQPHRITTNTWQCVDPNNGATKPCPAVPDGDVWVRLAQSDAATVSTATGALKTARTINHEWHQCNGGDGTKHYGNVRKSSTGDADGTVRAYTYTEYDCQDDATTYIVDKPMQVSVRDTADANPPLEEKWFYYDGSTSPGLNSASFKANVTRVDTWLDQWHVPPVAQDACPGGGKSCVRVTMTYDSFGNLTSVADHLNNLTATEYDTATSLYPERVTRAGFYRTKSVHDPKCGVRLSETILYQAGAAVPDERSQWQYDSFCRLIKTALPKDDIASAPHALYFYSLGGLKVPTKLQTRMREPSAPGGYVDGYTLSDGLGRVIQQQRTAVVIGNTGYLSDTTEYDAQGHAAKRYAPDSVTDLGTFDAPGTAVGFTTMLYDAMDRVIRITNPDGTTRENDHTVAWQTTTKDECYTGACAGGGGKIVERRDALGRVIERRWFRQDDFETRTEFTYDEIGRLTASKQGPTLSTVDDDTEITHSYDTLGRKLQTDDADSGVWNYRYDAIGNLKVADDPETTHHVQYCYDGLQRQTKSCAMNGNYSAPFNCSSGTCPGEQIIYSYDGTSLPYGWGRLSSVTDGSGSTTITGYDERGRITGDSKIINPPGSDPPTTANMFYEYDAADHLRYLTYPDGEVVRHDYNGVGQLRALRSLTHHVWYLTNLTYDEFSRPLALSHGNGAVDSRSYYGKTQNFRLEQVKTATGGTVHLQLDYASYAASGRLTALNDNGFKGPFDAMDASATYIYDGLGRLTQATGPKLLTHNFEYTDHLGNLTKKDGKTLTYDTAKPHTPVSFGTTALTHDDNGNRDGKGSQEYAYDYRDRLIDVNDGTVTFLYDHANRQVARMTSAGALTAYYSRYAEASDGHLSKYYFAGNQLIAMHHREVDGFALLTPAEPIELARVSAAAPALIVRLRGDTQIGAAIALAVLVTGLALAPWQRRGVAGMVLRHGDVVLVLLAFTCSSLPLPLIVQPAHAADQGCDPPPTSTPTRTPTVTSTPTRTPTQTPLSDIFHFHPDHLGSTHVITNATGGRYRFIRYTPFGSVRERFGASGASTGFDNRLRYEFTGYESEALSGLQYAGARFYDPDLAMFLNHDPARQFANPYAYGPWNPINGSDPTGAFWLEAFLIGFAVGFAASAIQAGVNGASLGEALKAGAISGIIGGVTGAGLGILGVAAQVAHPVIELAYSAALVGSGAYSTVQAFESGQGVAGVVGAVGLAFGLYGLGRAAGRTVSWVGGKLGVAQGDNNASRLSQGYSDGGRRSTVRRSGPGTTDSMKERITKAEQQVFSTKRGGQMSKMLSSSPNPLEIRSFPGMGSRYYTPTNYVMPDDYVQIDLATPISYDPVTIPYAAQPAAPEQILAHEIGHALGYLDPVNVWVNENPVAGELNMLLRDWHYDNWIEGVK